MRADAGFGYGPVLEMLETRPAQYAVVARMIPSLKRVLRGLRYEPMNTRWEIAEFEHHAHGWPHARRCIVARKRIEETDPEPTLFTLERYRLSGLAHEPAADAGRGVALLRWPRRYGATHSGAA